MVFRTAGSSSSSSSKYPFVCRSHHHLFLFLFPKLFVQLLILLALTDWLKVRTITVLAMCALTHIVRLNSLIIGITMKNYEESAILFGRVISSCCCCCCYIWLLLKIYQMEVKSLSLLLGLLCVSSSFAFKGQQQAIRLTRQSACLLAIRCNCRVNLFSSLASHRKRWRLGNKMDLRWSNRRANDVVDDDDDYEKSFQDLTFNLDAALVAVAVM